MASLSNLPGGPTIVAGHIHALQAAWFASQLERLRFFDVAHHIVERFQAGKLPLAAGVAVRRFLRSAAAQGGMSAKARRRLLTQMLRPPGGGAEAVVNKEFNDLWLRFVSSVATFRRQPDVSDLLRAKSRREVWHSARALAMHLSTWGSGNPFFAAKELAREINRFRDLLQDPVLRHAFGAHDMWDVVDQVAREELGDPRSVSRYRTVAVAGSTLLQWLAVHATALQHNREPPATTDLPGDALRKAVAHWLELALAAQAPAPLLEADAATSTSARVGFVRVTSLYIGETEKNLNVVFKLVKESNAVLLFNDADDLFGRRAARCNITDRVYAT
jgi:ATPase family associated with various cellular activities (AAA)